MLMIFDVFEVFGYRAGELSVVAGRTNWDEVVDDMAGGSFSAEWVRVVDVFKGFLTEVADLRVYSLFDPVVVQLWDCYGFVGHP